MTQRPLRVLSVEDEPLQQQLLAHALRAIPEFACEMAFETTEDSGIATFQRSRFDAVFVDYQLTEGNGLGVIRRLRQLDRVVPIIAVSGVAPAEIAAELVLSGADDYLDKNWMNSQALAHSLRVALHRADGLRSKLSVAADSTPRSEVGDLCTWVAASDPTAMLAHLERCEAAARATSAGPPTVVAWFEAAAERMNAGTTGIDDARLSLRPFLLDLLARLDSKPQSKLPPARPE